MRAAIYAGSFDPFTLGHLNILLDALNLFDRIIVVIAVNSDKKRRIDSDLMLEGIKKTLRDLPCSEKFTVITYEGLVFDLAVEENISYLIRGIRNGSDYEYEENIAKVNQSFGLKTIYIRANGYSHVSSSMVMELYKYGKDISTYVPAPVVEVLQKSSK